MKVTIKRKTIKVIVALKGGAGSGHYDHAGRPGKVGGSLPGKGVGAAMSIHSGKDAKFRQAIAKNNIIPLDEFHTEGVTPSYLAELEGYGKVIVKSIDSGNEYPEDGMQAEVDVYDISEELGWDAVPPTDIITDSEGFFKSTVQGWVKDDPYVIADLEKNSNYENLDIIDHRSYSRIVLLDMLTGNADRHDRNIVVDTNGKCWAIDNNRAFYSQYIADAQSIISNQRAWITDDMFGSGYNFEFHTSDIDAIINFATSDKFNTILSRHTHLPSTYALQDRIEEIKLLRVFND
jgi:hypothetical protein